MDFFTREATINIFAVWTILPDYIYLLKKRISQE